MSIREMVQIHVGEITRDYQSIGLKPREVIALAIQRTYRDLAAKFEGQGQYGKADQARKHAYRFYTDQGSPEFDMADQRIFNAVRDTVARGQN